MVVLTLWRCWCFGCCSRVGGGVGVSGFCSGVGISDCCGGAGVGVGVSDCCDGGVGDSCGVLVLVFVLGIYSVGDGRFFFSLWWVSAMLLSV